MKRQLKSHLLILGSKSPGFKKKASTDTKLFSCCHPEAAKIEDVIVYVSYAWDIYVCYFSHVLPMRPTEAACIWGSGARFPAGLLTRDVSRGKHNFIW